MAYSDLERDDPITLRLAFAPKPEGARAVSLAVRTFLAESGVDPRELFSYELCVAEASINAIEYAEGPARGLRPTIEVILTPEKLEIRLIDYTPGFDLPKKIAAPSPLDERGRGLFLIQSVMDEVLYIRGRRENALIMRKFRASGGGGPVFKKDAKDNPLVATPDVEYPLDDTDPFQVHPDVDEQEETAEKDLVRKFCWESLGQLIGAS
jgi:anti-sigma regulatory factor (Ser/Thr protein kinase)